MSMFSGKYDLYDHIAGRGGWYDKNGKPVKFGQEGVGCYYSDELQDFFAFKKATGGKIYQHHKVTVSELNQDFIKKHCKNFDFVKHVEQKPNKASKTGFREHIYYTYTYWGKEYTLKELNKHGVYIEMPIKFDTLFDLIPYYPYLVSVACSSEDGEYVVISNESYVDTEYKQHLQYGWVSELDYKKELQDHYLQVCKQYYLVDYGQRIKTTSLISCKPLHNGFYELILPTRADVLHEVSFIWDDGNSHMHWTSPKLEDEKTVLISDQDIEYYLAEDIKNNTVKVQYIEAMKEAPKCIS